MNVLVTGASRGLGLEFVRQYAATGARVFATCREPATASALMEITARHPNVSVHPLEVTSDGSVTALARALNRETLDVLINNAGIDGNPPGTGPRPRPREPIDYDKWNAILQVNTMSPYRVAMAFHDHLKRGDAPRLVTMSSRAGSMTVNLPSGLAYSSSKAAVNSVMHRLATSWGPEGICVLMLTPGWVHTEMGGAQAPLSPETSVTGMRQVIDAATLTVNGKFLDYRGTEVPW